MQKPLPGDLLNSGDWSTDGLVSCWLMNEDNNSNKVFDLSGNGNAGTLTGTAPSWTSGKFGSAILLPATDEWVNCGTNKLPNLAEPWTAMVWAIYTTTNDFDIVFSFSEVANEFISIGTTNVAGNWDLKIGSNGETAGDGTPVLPDVWHQWTLVWDGTSFHGHIDGVLNYSVVPGANDWQTATTICLGSRGNAAYLSGEISHAYIWERFLTASEIALLYREPFRMIRTKRRRIIVPEDIAAPTTFPYYYREIASRRIA